MTLSETKFPCLATAVRITTRKQESILSNLANGKWVRIHNSVLDCLVARDENEVIQNCQVAGIAPDEATSFVEVLKAYGFLKVTSSANAVSDQAELILRSAYLNVTDYCNLTCQHCYFGSHPGLGHGISNKALHEIVDRLYIGGVRFVVLAGGEPLTRPGIQNLLTHVASKNFDEVTLLTNGVLIDDELATILASTVDTIHVSLDGPDEATNALTRRAGSFQQIVQGIRKLRVANAKKIRIISTVTASNISKMQDVKSLCASLGVEFGTAIFAGVGRGRATQNLVPSHGELVNFFSSEVSSLGCDSTCLDVQAGVTCGSGVSMISVDCRGDVYPCHLLHRPEFKIGNLALQQNLPELVKSSPVASLFRGRTVEYRKCHGCSVEYFCKGGCLAHTIATHPDKAHGWKERDPYCKVHRAVISAQLWGL